MTTTSELTKPLSEQEATCLKQLELTVQRGLDEFKDVAMALRRIRDERLYREEYGTFQAYCATKWGLKRQRAYELIEAGTIAESIEPITIEGKVIKLEKEAHADTLKKFPVELRQPIFNLTAKATGGDFSAKQLSDVGIMITEGIEAGGMDDGTGVMKPLTQLVTAQLQEETYERLMRQKEHLKQHYAKSPRNCSNCKHWRPTTAADIDYATGKCTSLKIGWGKVVDSPARDGMMIVTAEGNPIVLTGMEFVCGAFERKVD